MMLSGAAACDAVLGLAAVFATFVAARAAPMSRDYIRFAASLYAGLSLAGLISAMDTTEQTRFAADSVALLVLPLAPAALALALGARSGSSPAVPLSAGLLLVSAATGIVAALTGTVFLGLAGLGISLGAMLVFAARNRDGERRAIIQTLAAILALVAGTAGLMTGNAAGFTSYVLFSAAGLTGIVAICVKPSNLAIQRPAASPIVGTRIGRAR
jgi:hypothetical protein